METVLLLKSIMLALKEIYKAYYVYEVKSTSMSESELISQSVKMSMELLRNFEVCPLVVH